MMVSMIPTSRSASTLFLHQHDAADPMFQQSADCIMENQVFGVSLYGNTIGSLMEKFRQYNFHGFPLLASSEHEVLLGYLHTDEMKSHFEEVVSSWGSAYTLDSPVRFKRFERLNPFSRGVLERKTVKGRTTCLRSVGLAVWFSVRFNRMINGAYKNADVDLSEFVDETIMRMVPETPLEQVHTMFQQLGIKCIFFIRHGFLQGMLTKKNYLKHMAEHHSKQHSSNPPPEFNSVASTDAQGPDPEKARLSLARRPSTIRRIKVDSPGLNVPLLTSSSPPAIVPDEGDEESSDESNGDKAGTLVEEIALRNVETSAMAAGVIPPPGPIVRRRTREFDGPTSVEKLSADMADAVERQDYITAGEIQARLRRLAQESPGPSPAAETSAKPSFKRHATMPVGGGATGVRRRQVLVKEQQTMDGMKVIMPNNLADTDLQGIAAKLPGNRGLL
mmetsp:Transcript_51276/g.135039  ORF Transcript_51276/g.135039 Transcript_51276/m.135039 type:complete len:447 (+) Transcript_51276:1553-2893(+)